MGLVRRFVLEHLLEEEWRDFGQSSFQQVSWFETLA